MAVGVGQTQGAGTGDQQHRNGGIQPLGQTATGQQPRRQGEGGKADDTGHEHRRHPVGQTLHRQFGGLGVIDHADDAGQNGVGANGRGAHDQRAGAVDAAAGQSVPRLFDHRQAFAGQQRFVDAGQARFHHAVHRDAFPRTDQHHVAHRHLFHRHHAFAPVAQQGGELRLQIDQPADGVAGLALGPFFQPTPQQHEGDDAGGGLEIQMMAPPQQRDDGMAIGGTSTDGDQRVHVGGAVTGQLDGAIEERPSRPQNHRGGQHQFQQAPRPGARHGHAQNHHRQGQGPGPQGATLGFGQTLALGFHHLTTLGQAVHGTRHIAQAGHQFFHRRPIQAANDGGGFRCIIDAGRTHPGIAPQAQLDQRRA